MFFIEQISPSGGDAAAGGRRGAFPMWRPCRGSPSRAKLVLCLHIIGPSYELPDRCQRRGCMGFQRPSGRFAYFSRAKARLSGFYQLTREALIKSLSAFILGFLCNARNGITRIASYLRSPMTKQCIKILIKADSMN